ncbi:MAG: hypothetical protein LBH69_05550 [Methanomassiliicoccaceae archaeon]|jgi:small neutral amino acid transporter SnatA (MarC family)|nr:hypothetical protein [Methanomassiliicoccaceae archaeon]
MTDYGDSPIDAKRTPGVVVIGAILMAVGMIIFFFAIYSLVMWALGNYSSFGLFGSILVMFLGTMVMAAGGVCVFMSAFRMLFGRRRRRRSLY